MYFEKKKKKWGFKNLYIKARHKRTLDIFGLGKVQDRLKEKREYKENGIFWLKKKNNISLLIA